jgi:hypothetical protein
MSQAWPLFLLNTSAIVNSRLDPFARSDLKQLVSNSVSANLLYPMQSAGLRKPLQVIKKYAKKLIGLLTNLNFQDSRLDPIFFFKSGQSHRLRKNLKPFFYISVICPPESIHLVNTAGKTRGDMLNKLNYSRTKNRTGGTVSITDQDTTPLSQDIFQEGLSLK